MFLCEDLKKVSFEDILQINKEIDLNLIKILFNEYMKNILSFKFKDAIGIVKVDKSVDDLKLFLRVFMLIHTLQESKNKNTNFSCSVEIDSILDEYK